MAMEKCGDGGGGDGGGDGDGDGGGGGDGDGDQKRYWQSRTKRIARLDSTKRRYMKARDSSMR